MKQTMTTISPWSFAADAIDPPTGLWTPYPKQALATDLAGKADETLFGGAAGPGKTEWLMEYGIDQMERYPNNYGVICRRVFPSLNRTVIPRLRIKLWKRAEYNKVEHVFRFPNGSRLELASLQYADTVLDFQGAEIGWLGFEEITEFLESQWEYMINRLRAPAPGIRPHACANANPGGPGHNWVKRRFVKPKPSDLEDGEDLPQPLEIWRPRAEEGRHTAEAPPLRRVFIPATHKDNPALLKNDPGYLARVLNLSNRGLRLAMEKGDWDAIDQIEGAMWSAGELDLGRLNPAFFKQRVRALRRVVAVDPSDGNEDGDEFGVSVCCKGLDGVGYVEYSDAWSGLSTRKMAEQSIELMRDMRADCLVVERNHGGKWMMEVFRQVDPYANVREVWASEGKRTRAEPVAALFSLQQDNLEMPYRARLVGFHEDLEGELITFTGKKGEVSPNRLDAMVWAMTDLMLGLQITKRDEAVKDQRLSGRR